jgi:hypothetical protein
VFPSFVGTSGGASFEARTMVAVLEICTAAARATFPILRLNSFMAARATSLPGDSAGDHLQVAKFMAVDLGRHPVQPLAGSRPRTVTSSTEWPHLFSTDMSPICLPLFVF